MNFYAKLILTKKIIFMNNDSVWIIFMVFYYYHLKRASKFISPFCSFSLITLVSLSFESDREKIWEKIKKRL